MKFDYKNSNKANDYIYVHDGRIKRIDYDVIKKSVHLILVNAFKKTKQNFIFENVFFFSACFPNQADEEIYNQKTKNVTKSELINIALKNGFFEECDLNKNCNNYISISFDFITTGKLQIICEAFSFDEV